MQIHTHRIIPLLHSIQLPFLNPSSHGILIKNYLQYFSIPPLLILSKHIQVLPVLH